MSKIRILLVDDHAIFREGMRALLRLHEDIEVVGEAANGKEAIEETLKHEPDVVLMDIAMPGLGGLEATIEIKKQRPQTKILVLTQYEDREYIYRFLEAGASGFLVKKAAGTELLSAIRAVNAGESFLHPSVASTVIEEYLKGRKPLAEKGAYESLSDREKQILKLLAEGQSNKEIAALLGISVKTVMGHRSNIMEKLDIHSRTDLIKFAIRRGIIKV